MPKNSLTGANALDEENPLRRDVENLLQQRIQPAVINPADVGFGKIGNFLAKDPGQFAKGALSAPFTAAPDILGLVGQGFNKLNNITQPGAELPNALRDPFPKISGDPIRQAIGLDPKNPQGRVGEFFDPTVSVSKLAGLAAKGVVAAGKGLLAMTLFHGTPHKFDKFSIDKIGSGEGAQAFGHGLYFAENPSVARSYQSKLSPGRGGDGEDIAARVVQDIQDSGNSFEVSKDLAIRDFTNRRAGSTDPEFIQRMDDAIQSVKSESFQGSLYEVEIPDNITARMLDWDAPLSEQPESVRKVLLDIPELDPRNQPIPLEFKDKPGFHFKDPDGLTGQEAYRGLVHRLGVTDKEVSARLAEAGIPGIRYFDGGSRQAGDGTRNIVVFNPDDITSVKRDGNLVFEDKLGLKPEAANEIAADLDKARR